MIKISIMVRHGSDNVARSGKISASCTMSPHAAAQRCALKCAGLLTKDNPFPDFEKSGITLRRLAGDPLTKTLYEAEWADPIVPAAA